MRGCFRTGRRAGVLSHDGAGDGADDTLRSATQGAAQLLGIAEKVGTLEKGKLADIIAIPGDPTQDINTTERVFFG